MKKKFIMVFMLILVLSFITPSYAKNTVELPEEDSTELKYQDMIMLFLGPHIDQAISDHYSFYLKKDPIVYPYQIKVKKVNRINEFREFHFVIILEVTPVVGPHITVGKDKLIFEVSPTLPEKVKLLKFEHLETHELPPVWMHLLRKKPSL
ncbi:DUF3888 domain-containing protein [Pseudalkalibacillus sp. R45]|uniref:DUF3888 domain-containing protein n=1 Tax=Pseudalkalibacillus sp. R45 TaxID=3457433 RepID=UPI003FCC4928